MAIMKERREDKEDERILPYHGLTIILMLFDQGKIEAAYDDVTLHYLKEVVRLNQDALAGPLHEYARELRLI